MSFARAIKASVPKITGWRREDSSCGRSSSRALSLSLICSSVCLCLEVEAVLPVVSAEPRRGSHVTSSRVRDWTPLPPAARVGRRDSVSRPALVRRRNEIPEAEMVCWPRERAGSGLSPQADPGALAAARLPAQQKPGPRAGTEGHANAAWRKPPTRNPHLCGRCLAHV